MEIRTLSSFGGALFNYSAVIDPTRDEDVKYRNRYVCDVAEFSHTRAAAICRFVGVNGADPTDPLTGLAHDALWGNSPSVKPVYDRTNEGVWTVTFPATVNSELTSATAAQGGGVQYTVNLREAFAQCKCSDGTLRHVTAEVTQANVVTVRGFLANGTADDLAGQVIAVWAW